LRARIVVVERSADPQAIVAELVRLGGDPKTLEGDDGERAFAVTLDDAGARRIARKSGVARVLSQPSPHPRSARRGETTRIVRVRAGRDTVEIGGGVPIVVAGPCAVETEAQLDACARAVADAGGKMLRGGAFKPRTSPYSFAGHGHEALRLLREVADRHGLAVVTELLDPRDVERAAPLVDVVQIGARSMSDFALLREVAKVERPILLKRSPAATLDELLHAAEHLLAAGAHDVILCERGIRGFDPAARNTLDLAAVPLLRMRTDLPVLVDPSHGVGVREAVVPMAFAAIAAGADGVLVECHPDAGRARSDGPQALALDVVPRLFSGVDAIARAMAPHRVSLAAE
jgi:3-deoxy-7-phosphoheptulonate synthase